MEHYSMEYYSMNQYSSQLELEEMMEQLEELLAGKAWDLSSMLEQILEGDWKSAFLAVLQSITGSFRHDLAGMKALMASIVLLCMLSVLVSVFLSGFENHRIAEIAHLVFYLLLLAILLKIFARCYQTAGQALEAMTQLSHLVLPALCLSLGPAAGSTTALGYYELALLVIFLVESFLLRLCLPLLPAFMLLLLMNGIWEGQKLTALMELVEKALLAAVKCSLAAVTGLGVLQSMVAPALDGLKRSAAQKAISAIPGLGGIADGATQLLLGSAILLKNSLGMFALLLLVAVMAPPLLELLLYGVLLKVSGALAGIAADGRLTACIVRTADAVLLCLRLVFCGAACFFVMTAIVTCLVGNG